MDIYNGAGSILNWIGNTAGSIGNVVVDAGNYTSAFFNNIGAAITAGIGSLIYYPTLAIISFLALIQYVFYVIFELVNYLLAPVWFIINLITGFYAALAQSYALAANSYIFNNAVAEFITDIPGLSTLFIMMNAVLWLLLIIHVFREIKEI